MSPERLIKQLQRELRVTKEYKAELEECLASAREQILELRKDLAKLGDRRFIKDEEREGLRMTTATKKQTAVHIRWMIRRDMPEVLAIEEARFEFPWAEEDFIRCLRQRNAIGMVACEGGAGGKILGFMVYELHRNRLHLLNLAVRQKGIGTGRAMIQKLLTKLSAIRRNKIMCEVRESNIDAQCWLRALGFRAISVLRDFYEEHTTEDAYLFEYRYVATAEELAEMRRLG